MSALDEAPNMDLNHFRPDLHGSWDGLIRPVAGLPFVARAPQQAALDFALAAVEPNRKRGEHVHLANAYSVSLASTDPAVAAVFEDRRAWLLPDGKPITWISALRRDDQRLRQVRGPQFMLDVIDLGRPLQLRHYLLGGSPQVLAQLRDNLERDYPGIVVVGAESPPFRSPTEEELAERDERIRASGAQVVWVGLGTPKQDFEAERLARSLPILAAAVGAAFDYAAGTLAPAPRWISAIGCEWLWRFAAEPRRLWRRYTVGNILFLRAAILPHRKRSYEILLHRHR